MIELQNVQKVYNTRAGTVAALGNVSLRVDPGEFVAIVGPSGSGKTTLLQILGGLDVPTKGIYLLNGERVDGLTDAALSELRNRTMGFVFQNFNLLSRTTGLENVLTPGLYSDAPPEPGEAEALMKRLGILHRGTHYPAEMSGGEQQRVAIARALIMRPAILLADEPTGNLDATTGEEILSLLADLNRSGLTILVVTHDPSVAARAHRTIMIRDGQIVTDDKLEIPGGRLEARS